MLSLFFTCNFLVFYVMYCLVTSYSGGSYLAVKMLQTYSTKTQLEELIQSL